MLFTIILRRGSYLRVVHYVYPGDRLRSGLDDVGKMDYYRNKVITQPGSARIARNAATMLLVSRLYFEISSLPRDAATPF